MSQKSSERLTRYFSSSSLNIWINLLIFFIFSFVHFVLSAYSEEIITPSELSTEFIRKIEEEVKSFKKPLEGREYQEIVSKTEKEVKKVIGQDNRDNISFCSFDSGPTIYYFFSFSMPEELILKVFKEGIRINQECQEKISFILRGFVKNDLRITINELYKYLQKIGDDLPVEIDPELFEMYGVKTVPQILKINDNKIGLIKGDLVSLSYAISRFREELKDYGTFGNLYSVKEEDILKVFASKQKGIEERLRERLSEIKDKMMVLSKYDGYFEYANKDRIYYINPKVILEDNIYDHKGDVIIPKGTVFNPMEYAKLGRYIVIDGNSQKQVEFALNGNFKKIILISGNLQKLITTYGKPFYFANDELIERFRIKRVPAIIEGDGEYVKVTEKAL